MNEDPGDIYTRVEAVCKDCGLISSSCLNGALIWNVKRAKDHNKKYNHYTQVNIVSRTEEFLVKP